MEAPDDQGDEEQSAAPPVSGAVIKKDMQDERDARKAKKLADIPKNSKVIAIRRKHCLARASLDQGGRWG